MKRRDFLSLGLAPLLLAGSAHASQETGKPMSRAARGGFFPNVPLGTQNGEKVRFYDDLIRDKTVLFNFFLVQCTDGVCPMTIANMRRVQDLLGERMGRDIYFLSITLEPKKDTPKILKEYSDNFDIKPGWSFVTGKPEDVDALRHALGYVDLDPAREKDLSYHVAMATYGNDTLERWGTVSLNSSAKHIATTLQWLTDV